MLARLQASTVPGSTAPGDTAGTSPAPVVDPFPVQADPAGIPPVEIQDLRATLLRDLAGRETAVPTLVPPAPAADPPPAPVPPDNGMEEYARLQRRLLLATLILSALAVPLTAWLFDRTAALSLLLGSVAGMLYLRLLARSVARIGADSRQVGKSQLLVPIVLVLASARVPQLEIVPALIGFLLYKPALLLQALVRP